MIKETKEERMLADELTKYVKEKHTSEECIGFIDGFKKALLLAKNNEVLDLVSNRDVYADLRKIGLSSEQCSEVSDYIEKL